MSVYRLKGTSGALMNQSFPLADGLVIGAGEGCDITLGEAAQGARATLQVQGNGAVILVTEAGAVAVNGDTVKEQSLAGGDELRIGAQRFLLQAPGLRPERVLTEAATRGKTPVWPWWLAAALLAGGALTAWQQGWLQQWLGS